MNYKHSMSTYIKDFYKNQKLYIENLRALSKEQTKEELKNTNFKITGKSCNRTLIKNNPILYKSILENTKDLDEITKNKNYKNLTSRIKFIVEYNYDINSLKCISCNTFIFSKESYCKKCSPKYPSKRYFIQKYKNDWFFEYKNDILKRKKYFKGHMNLSWFEKKYGIENGYREYVNHYKKIIQNKPYSKISQELFWKVYNELTEEEKVLKVKFEELNKEEKIYLIKEERLKYDKLYFSVDFLYDNKIIEFQGSYWHKKTKKQDVLRKKILIQNGYDVLFIKEKEYEKNKELVVNKCLEFIRSDMKINTKYQVLTKDGFKDFKGIKRVTKKDYIKIEFDDKSIIKCSKNHKFVIKNKIKFANQLNNNDTLENKRIIKIEKIKELCDLFDLVEVNGSTYITDNFTSHNCDFLTSGNTVFDQKILEQYKKEGLITEPIQKTNFDNNLWIWKHPDYSKNYLVALDVARGDGADFSAIQVICVEDMEQVAEYKGKIPTDMLGNLAVQLATMYNKALLIPENNTFGWATIQKIQEIGYSNLYWSFKSLVYSNVNNWGSEDRDKIPGINTNEKTRPLIITKFDEALRHKSIIIHSIRLFDECTTFIYSERDGQPRASQGYYDDLIIAMSIAVFVRSTTVRMIDARKQVYNSMPTLFSRDQRENKANRIEEHSDNAYKNKDTNWVI